MRSASFALAVGLMSFELMASSLGVYGNVYPIAEQDAVEMIKSKLGDMQKTGELDRVLQDFRDANLKAIEDPPPVAGIGLAPSIRVFQHDPTFAFQEDVRSHDGTVIVRAGQRLNPLVYRPLSKGILFLDGTDPVQSEIARKHKADYPRDTVVLTAGSYVRMTRELGSPIYYDQRGILTGRFGIQNVPAYVRQDGVVLSVTEFPPGDYKAINKVE